MHIGYELFVYEFQNRRLDQYLKVFQLPRCKKPEPLVQFLRGWNNDNGEPNGGWGLLDERTNLTSGQSATRSIARVSGREAKDERGEANDGESGGEVSSQIGAAHAGAEEDGSFITLGAEAEAEKHSFTSDEDTLHAGRIGVILDHDHNDTSIVQRRAEPQKNLVSNNIAKMEGFGSTTTSTLSSA